jgi:hypothetical protein
MATVNTTFTAAVSFISQVVPIDPHFLDLMQHLCDFQEMARATSGAATYGHRTISRTTVAQTTPDRRCRLRSLTAQEIEDSGRAGETIDDYILYVPMGYLPQEMADEKSSTRFQVINIRRLSGDPEDAGPFDVQSVRKMAGEQHHYQVRLRRVR